MPALRERADDIPLIADHFLAKYTREMGKTHRRLLARGAGGAGAPTRGRATCASSRTWSSAPSRSNPSGASRSATLPENLRNGQPATSTRAHGDDAIAEAGAGFNLERHLQDIERSHLERALERAGGVQTRAADVLGLSFRQFRYLAKKYGLR